MFHLHQSKYFSFKWVLIASIAILLFTQQGLVGHTHIHDSATSNCTMCKMLDHNNSIEPANDPQTVLFVISILVAIEFRKILLARKNRLSPFLRAPPILLK